MCVCVCACACVCACVRVCVCVCVVYVVGGGVCYGFDLQLDPGSESGFVCVRVSVRVSVGSG